jgi:hypothetical protein
VAGGVLVTVLSDVGDGVGDDPLAGRAVDGVAVEACAAGVDGVHAEPGAHVAGARTTLAGERVEEPWSTAEVEAGVVGGESGDGVAPVVAVPHVATGLPVVAERCAGDLKRQDEQRDERGTAGGGDEDDGGGVGGHAVTDAS